MKRMIVLPIAVTVIVLLGFSAVLLGFRGEEKLSESEKFAMEKLPEYFFVFEGQTNYISKASTHKEFLNQHPMIEYLELVAQEFAKCDWPQDIPVEITETKTHIIVTWPSMPQILGIKNAFGAGYRKQIIIDKSTKKIISNLVGLIQWDDNFILHEQCITRCQLSQYLAPLPLEHNFGLPKET